MKIEKHKKGTLDGQVNVRQTLANMAEGEVWKVRREGMNLNTVRCTATQVAQITGAVFNVIAPAEENWIKVVRTR